MLAPLKEEGDIKIQNCVTILNFYVFSLPGTHICIKAPGQVAQGLVVQCGNCLAGGGRVGAASRGRPIGDGGGFGYRFVAHDLLFPLICRFAGGVLLFFPILISLVGGAFLFPVVVGLVGVGGGLLVR